MDSTRRAVFAGALLFAASATSVSAAETWCDTDPPVVITTPAGNQVVVYVVNGGPAEHVTSLTYPAISVTVNPIQAGTATSVHLTAVIPDDLFGSHYSVTSEIWSGPARTGMLYANRSGYSGEPLPMQFTLDVP
ncbi:MAG: hypothetical protein HY332_22335 [Chloroflexi bacterium]|nr:hypothetical protein [Chloroflexota bacterium]